MVRGFPLPRGMWRLSEGSLFYGAAHPAPPPSGGRDRCGPFIFVVYFLAWHIVWRRPFNTATYWFEVVLVAASDFWCSSWCGWRPISATILVTNGIPSWICSFVLFPFVLFSFWANQGCHLTGVGLEWCWCGVLLRWCGTHLSSRNSCSPLRSLQPDVLYSSKPDMGFC